MKNKNKLKLTLASVAIIVASGYTVNSNADQINGLEITANTGWKDASGSYKTAFITSDGDEWTPESDGSYTNLRTGIQGFLAPDASPIIQEIPENTISQVPTPVAQSTPPTPVQQNTSQVPTPVAQSTPPTPVQQNISQVPTPVAQSTPPTPVQQNISQVPTPVAQSTPPTPVQQNISQVPTPVAQSTPPTPVQQNISQVPTPVAQSTPPTPVQQNTSQVPTPAAQSTPPTPVQQNISQVPTPVAQSTPPTSVQQKSSQALGTSLNLQTLTVANDRDSGKSTLKRSSLSNHFNRVLENKEIKSVVVKGSALSELPLTGSDSGIEFSSIGALTFGLSVLLMKGKKGKHDRA